MNNAIDEPVTLHFIVHLTDNNIYLTTYSSLVTFSNTFLLLNEIHNLLTTKNG